MSAATVEVQEMVERPSSNGESLYEVVEGCRVKLPPMSILAARTAFILSTRMEVFIEDRGLGRAVTEGLFIIDPRRDLRRRPDVAFVSKERWPLDRPLPKQGDWEIVPDLAVEVISPNDLFNEVITKLRQYLRYGVRQVWLVLPNDQEVHMHEHGKQPRILTPGEDLEGGELLPGFRLPLSTLFRESALAETHTG